MDGKRVDLRFALDVEGAIEEARSQA